VANWKPEWTTKAEIAVERRPSKRRPLRTPTTLG
jgi:hypothetical protein